MRIQRLEFNMFPVNSYILWDDKTGESAIIDAGCYYPKEQETLLQFIQENKLQVKYLLATHLHLDHNFGNPFTARTFHVPLEAAREDEFLLANMPEQANMFGISLPESPIPIGKYIKEGDTFMLGNESLNALHVPGHSPGSMVFYAPDSGFVISGDTLFMSSIGRADLPGGNYEQLVKAITDHIMTLPSDTVVYPGHGPETNVYREKKYNPFLQ